MADHDPGSCIVLGAGGHARVLMDCLEAAGEPAPFGVLDPDQSLWGKKMEGVTVLGDDDLLSTLPDQGVGSFIVGVGGLTDSALRRRLCELGRQHGLRPRSVIHPSATISRRAQLADGVQVLAGAIINTGARVGENAIVSTGAIVEHDCTLGAHSHVASGARLAGAVCLEPGAFVGVGATIINNVTVGADAVVGAGAVVIRGVSARTTVTGVPARVRAAS